MTTKAIMLLHRYLTALVLTCVVLRAAAQDTTLLGETMGTTYRATVPAHVAHLKPRIDALLKGIDAQMSTYRPNSELSRLNTNQSVDWLSVSPELFAVIQAAQEVSIATGGAFDVTVGPLVNFWGFGPEARIERPPAEDAIVAARARVGYRQVELADGPPRVRKVHSDLYIDLSSLAEGYAVDRVAALLEAEGLRDYLVDIGGEILARGRNGKGKAWKIGVALPVAGTDEVEWALNITNIAFSTSGDYRNFFEYQGNRYSHEIDPASGRPVRNHVASRKRFHTLLGSTSYIVLQIKTVT